MCLINSLKHAFINLRHTQSHFVPLVIGKFYLSCTTKLSHRVKLYKYPNAKHNIFSKCDYTNRVTY